MNYSSLLPHQRRELKRSAWKEGCSQTSTVCPGVQTATRPLLTVRLHPPGCSPLGRMPSETHLHPGCPRSGRTQIPLLRGTSNPAWQSTADASDHHIEPGSSFHGPRHLHAQVIRSCTSFCGFIMTHFHHRFRWQPRPITSRAIISCKS